MDEPVLAVVAGVELGELARRDAAEDRQERVGHDQRLALVRLAVDLGRLARPAAQVELPVGPLAAAVLVQRQDPAGQLVADQEHAPRGPGQDLRQALGGDVPDEDAGPSRAGLGLSGTSSGVVVLPVSICRRAAS